jgi:hypothetical protein
MDKPHGSQMWCLGEFVAFCMLGTFCWVVFCSFLVDFCLLMRCGGTVLVGMEYMIGGSFTKFAGLDCAEGKGNSATASILVRNSEEY